MKDLKDVVADLKQGDGTAGLLLSDTLMRQSLFKSAVNIEQEQIVSIRTRKCLKLISSLKNTSRNLSATNKKRQKINRINTWAHMKKIL
ncbi:MAG: hypothetical protein ABI663_07475 [Chryseolinea sp.]